MKEIIRLIRDKGYFSGFFIGFAKILMAFLSHSVLIFIHAIYNIIKTYARHYSTKENSGYKMMFYSGLLVVLASMVYLIYSVYIWVFGSNSVYHMYIAIGIAAVTTYELIVAIVGIKRAKKDKDARLETVKFINFASALISVSLTQTAILSFTNTGDMSKAYAIGDAIFGFMALLTGVLMMHRANGLEDI